MQGDIAAATQPHQLKGHLAEGQQDDSSKAVKPDLLDHGLTFVSHSAPLLKVLPTRNCSKENEFDGYLTGVEQRRNTVLSIVYQVSIALCHSNCHRLWGTGILDKTHLQVHTFKLCQSRPPKS